jgi:hypothetical protein
VPPAIRVLNPIRRNLIPITKTLKGGHMYSPKISEQYIPVLYHLAKSKGIRMTHLVNQILSEALKEVMNDQDGTLTVSKETALPPKVNRRSRGNGNTPRSVSYQP